MVATKKHKHAVLPMRAPDSYGKYCNLYAIRTDALIGATGSFGISLQNVNSRGETIMTGQAKQALIRSSEVRVSPNRAWVGPPGEHCAEPPDVEVEEHQGIVVAVRLICPCGRETRIELDYANNPS